MGPIPTVTRGTAGRDGSQRRWLLGDGAQPAGLLARLQSAVTTRRREKGKERRGRAGDGEEEERRNV